VERADEYKAIEVVVVDGEEAVRRTWRRILPSSEFALRPAPSLGLVPELLETTTDVLVLELTPVSEPLLAWIGREHPDVEVVVMMDVSAGDTGDMAEGIQAFGLIAKPIASATSALLTVRAAAERRRLRWRVREMEEAVRSARAPSPAVRIVPQLVRHAEWSPSARAGYAALKERALTSFERDYVQSLLAHTQGNISHAARIAGLDRSNFRRIVKRIRRDSLGEGVALSRTAKTPSTPRSGL
jgi:DNA-binding NtrC family response regulator